MIDFLFIIVMILAVIKGLKKGLIVAVFSIVAFIIGLAAAIKLSAMVAVYLQQHTEMPGQWLPFLSFLLVFIIVVVLVNMGGRIIEKAFEMAFLGGINKLGGSLFYALLYTLIFSVMVFYAERTHFIKQESFDKSLVYPFIKPWGPVVIDGLGKLIPFFKDSFDQLKNFFESLSHKVSH